MIAAPVQCDVDEIPKGSHYVRVPIAIGRPNDIEFSGERKRVRCDEPSGSAPKAEERPGRYRRSIHGARHSGAGKGFDQYAIS